MIGPNWVSSSRTTTFATNAVTMKIAHGTMTKETRATVYDELRTTWPPQPSWRASDPTAAQVSRKKIRLVIQKAGDLSW